METSAMDVPGAAAEVVEPGHVSELVADTVSTPGIQAVLPLTPTVNLTPVTPQTQLLQSKAARTATHTHLPPPKPNDRVRTRLLQSKVKAKVKCDPPHAPPSPPSQPSLPIHTLGRVLSSMLQLAQLWRAVLPRRCVLEALPWTVVGAI